MPTFPESSWQSSLIRKVTHRRPRISPNFALGRVASAITPRLYLSDLYTARAAGNLERLGVTHVVSAIEVDLRSDFGDRVTVMHVPIRDDPDVDIAWWFRKVVKFIQDALDADERHKVLVHCFQGISRSATLVCAYLVATTPMRAVDAIALVRSRRGIVAPNFGFRRQLVAWERQCEEARVNAATAERRRGVLGDAVSRWIRRVM